MNKIILIIYKVNKNSMKQNAKNIKEIQKSLELIKYL